jgi:hypothetical protein
MARAKVKAAQRTRGGRKGQSKVRAHQASRKRGALRSPSLGRRSGTAARPGELARAERRRRGKKPVRRPVRA